MFYRTLNFPRWATMEGGGCVPSESTPLMQSAQATSKSTHELFCLLENHVSRLNDKPLTLHDKKTLLHVLAHIDPKHSPLVQNILGKSKRSSHDR